MKQASIAPELKLRCVRVSYCHVLNTVTVVGAAGAVDAVSDFFARVDELC